MLYLELPQMKIFYVVASIVDENAYLLEFVVNDEEYIEKLEITRKY